MQNRQYFSIFLFVISLPKYIFLNLLLQQRQPLATYYCLICFFHFVYKKVNLKIYIKPEQKHPLLLCNIPVLEVCSSSIICLIEIFSIPPGSGRKSKFAFIWGSLSNITYRSLLSTHCILFVRKSVCI